MNSQKKIKYIGFAALAVFAVSLCFGTATAQFIPMETVKNYAASLWIGLQTLLDPGYDASAVTDALPYYAQTMARFKMSVISFFSGAAVCFAGAVFQTVFKNPIASPNILGISTGVSMGNIVFILIFQLQAYACLQYRYLICYGISAVLMIVIIALGSIRGRGAREYSVDTIIILGMIINHLGSAFTTYYKYIIETDEEGLAEILSLISSGNLLYVDKTSFMYFICAVGISVVPLFLIRYRFNIVAFDDDEIKAMGMSNRLYRGAGLLLGGIMATAALVHCGDVGFLAMVIPFICRKKLQADFRIVSVLSMLLGGIFTCAARIIYEISVMNLPFIIPAGDIITLIVLPVFVFSLVKREGAFL